MKRSAADLRRDYAQCTDTIALMKITAGRLDIPSKEYDDTLETIRQHENLKQAIEGALKHECNDKDQTRY